ncbi:MAG TPA: hypothetical protein DCQ51_08925 [Planktothrix sp. UBA8407]|jgi:Protein of unknown function (DUF2949).|nr:hypothetical protein [Planktothrix sp. UBA8402]HAO11275.1 hypothetical protein [Planktothrix sp. UBA8407]HBK22114.1 hypothetical protein [Planktothrix sp. UBA10369]
MTPSNYSRFIHFLQDELSLSADSIAMAERANHPTNSQHQYQDPSPVSMTLWQYGLVTLEQLDKIFDWLETA